MSWSFLVQKLLFSFLDCSRDSCVISSKSDRAGWLPGLFIMETGCFLGRLLGGGPELHFHMWSSRCPFVYAVSQFPRRSAVSPLLRNSSA